MTTCLLYDDHVKIDQRTMDYDEALHHLQASLSINLIWAGDMMVMPCDVSITEKWMQKKRLRQSLLDAQASRGYWADFLGDVLVGFPPSPGLISFLVALSKGKKHLQGISLLGTSIALSVVEKSNLKEGTHILMWQEGDFERHIILKDGRFFLTRFFPKTEKGYAKRELKHTLAYAHNTLTTPLTGIMILSEDEVELGPLMQQVKPDDVFGHPGDVIEGIIKGQAKPQFLVIPPFLKKTLKGGWLHKIADALGWGSAMLACLFALLLGVRWYQHKQEIDLQIQAIGRAQDQILALQGAFPDPILQPVDETYFKNLWHQIEARLQAQSQMHSLIQPLKFLLREEKQPVHLTFKDHSFQLTVPHPLSQKSISFIQKRGLHVSEDKRKVYI